MGAIMESVFCAAYLFVTAVLGILLLRQGKRLFAALTLTLVGGDAFHLLPRVYGNVTGTLGELGSALGFGTLVTSVTMTVFYVLLYHFFCKRYGKPIKANLTAAVYFLAVGRIVLCAFPQNNWLTGGSPTWGIIRNVPFVILGVLLVGLLFKWAWRDRFFKYAWLAVLLSFVFYVPVVLFADAFPIAGTLMLPKTACYVWLVIMGYRADVSR
jgi:hypothetical protein